MSSIDARVEQCFRTAFPDLPEQQLPRATMSSVAQWDSLNMLVLVSLIEEEFAMQIPSDDLGDFVSFELIVDYLESRCDATDA